LTSRAQFLRAAKGTRASRGAVALQAGPASGEFAGLGFTVTKKAGNAPERNRIKRRLRAAAASCASAFESSNDYVLLGRREALTRPFPALVADLQALIDKVHSAPTRRNQT
jgi:ribonuclease P protein component